MTSSSARSGRGRVEPDAPKPKPKMVFGVTKICPTCKGKGMKKGDTCRGCDGQGVIDE